MSTSRDAPVVCTICDSRGTLLCVQCRNVHYCSTGCQRADWPTHKLLCSSFSDFQVPPGPMFRRAILFPVDEKKPKFVWVEVELKGDHVGDASEGDELGETSQDEEFDEQFEWPKMGNLLGARDPRPDLPTAGRNIIPTGSPLQDQLYCQANALRDRELDHTIEVVFRDGFLVDGSSPNESVAVATNGAHAHQWAGNVVVFRKKGIDGETPFYGDMTLTDFRVTVDFFVTYNNDAYQKKAEKEAPFPDSFTAMSLNTVKEVNGEVKDGMKGKAKGEVKGKVKGALKGGVKGVRISCEGDLREHRVDKYIQVEVEDEYLFAKADPIAISRLIELPIVVRKGPPPRETFPTAADNQEVTFLHLDLDPSSKLFGRAPPTWRRNVGSVVAMRVDRRPLYPQHMEALCYFCQFVLQPVIEDALEGERTREQALRYMTKAKFEKFFMEYKADQDYSEAWAATASPYST